MNKLWNELQYENCEFNFDNFVEFIFSWENDLIIIEFSFKEYIYNLNGFIFGKKIFSYFISFLNK